MKWANHKLVTTVVVFAGTGNLLYAAYSFLGSVLPDRLEGKPPKESKAYWKWRSKHRQNTHWTVPYLAIIAVLYYLHEIGILHDLSWEIAKLPIFVCVGALLHILEDGFVAKYRLYGEEENRNKIVSCGKFMGIFYKLYNLFGCFVL